jgi:hypothetical protein
MRNGTAWRATDAKARLMRIVMRIDILGGILFCVTL